MRAALTLLAVLDIAARILPAQNPTLKTTVPLVVAPTTITGRDGHYVRGLTAADLMLLDNNVPRQIHVDELTLPVSVVLVVETSEECWAALDKIRKIGSIIEPLVAGDRGEAAVIWYSQQIIVAQQFTSNTSTLERVFQDARPNGSGGMAIDAVAKALDMLSERKDNRRVILLLGETKDRGSKIPLEQVVSRAQRDNVSVYSVTYSRYLMTFTHHWEEVCDAHHENCKPPDPPPWIGPDLMDLFGELRALAKTNVAEAFTQYTGGRRVSFLKQKGLEQVVQNIGEEIHNQYLLSFTPPAETEEFHQIRVLVPAQPDLLVRTRPGYWPVPE
jgi:VWFA-related protein